MLSAHSHARPCPQVRHSDVVKITASHYFGIVPLHVNQDHQVAYLQKAAALISSLPHSAVAVS